MPIVFIHGVSTRAGPSYDRGKAEREAFFRSFLLPGLTKEPARVSVSFPYWGEFGAKMAWKGACLPSGTFEALGTQETETELHLGACVNEELPDPDRVLMEVAKANTLESVVDLLWMSALDNNENTPEQLASSAVQAANYAANNRKPSWLEEINDDESLIVRLCEAISESSAAVGGKPNGDWEALGGGGLSDLLGDAAGWLKQKVEAKGSRVLVNAARAGLQAAATNFIGDIFVYLEERGTPQAPGKIIGAVGQALTAAGTTRTKADPLVVIAHSLGGEIAYDLLSVFHTDVTCDILVTVGSQVSLFEELKLLAFENDYPQQDHLRVPRPRNVARWINIFDRNDVLGFAAASIFEEVEDFVYDTGEGSRAAHSAYFRQPSFYNRLSRRLRGV